VGVRGEVPDNPCQARDGFGSGDDIENTSAPGDRQGVDGESPLQ